ncbi:MAG: hypothetical protein MK135_02730 [Polyangiaceae bacterium]|nr:hypothetical protein [Polyangiaceae bacterium]
MLSPRSYFFAVIALVCGALSCSLSRPVDGQPETSLSEAEIPVDLDWKFTVASSLSFAEEGQELVILRDTGEVVFRGRPPRGTELKLPALRGQKDWIIQDGNGQEIRRVSVNGESQ